MKKIYALIMSVLVLALIFVLGVKNISAESENIISGGDFEGILDYAEGETELKLPDPAFGNDKGIFAGYGSGAWDSYVKAVKDPTDNANTCLKFSYTVTGKAFSSFFKFATIKAGKTYNLDFDYMVNGTTDNFGVRFAGAPTLEEIFYSGTETNGWKHVSLEWNTNIDATYDSIAMWFNTGSSLDNVGYIDNIVIKEKKTSEPLPTPTPKPENPFDENKTYYASSSKTVNGDFEKFSEGTIFSEEQLEGAWGSVSLDTPATIAIVDNNKVMDLTKGEKPFTSAFLMLPDELEIGGLYRLSYDIKLALKEDLLSYKVIDSSFVGGANVEYYLLDYKTIDFSATSNQTSGAEQVHYPIKITLKENGWYNVSIDLQLTNRDLIQCNSLRFLFTAKNEEDHMYIDNVNLYELSETPFNTDVEVNEITFTDGVSIALNVNDTKKLSYAITPENATNKEVTFSSSNTDVATVDENGIVKAIAKGSCAISVTTSNGQTAEIAVIVNSVSPKTTNNNNTGLIVGIVCGVILLAGGVTFIVIKSKKH